MTSYRLRGLLLPEEPPQVNAEELRRLAEELASEDDASSPTRDQVRHAIRNIDQIMFAIQGGQEVTLLEWVYVLHKKESWDQNNPELARPISQKIWEIANNNSALESRLLWRVFLAYCSVAYGDGRTDFSHSLLTTFRDSNLYSKDSSAIKILHIPGSLVERFLECTDAYAYEYEVLLGERMAWEERVAESSLDNLQTPSDLFSRAGLPPKSIATEHVLTKTTSLFCKIHSPDQKQMIWLRSCLDSMKESLLVEKIEPLLSHLSQQESIEQQLVEWLRQRFDPKSPNSLWDKLSQSAKQHLRKILGNATYQDFQQWVGLLLKALPLQDWEKNQLSRRSEFWSNYSERFERFRILLPSESIRVLGNSISQEDYDQLLDDGSSPTEIGIFDIGGYFIVEFFRGPGSEVRIFNKRDIDIDLCSAKDLSPKRIRSLSAADVHDHKFIWQSSCEKWLRKMRILPNSGVEYFKGLSRVHGKYSPSTGLPSPNATDQTNRDKQLQKWRRDIEDLEQEARKYYAADSVKGSRSAAKGEGVGMFEKIASKPGITPAAAKGDPNAPVWLVFTFVPQDGSEPEMSRMAQLAGHQQGVIALEKLSLAMETDPRVSFLKKAWAFLPAEAKVSRITRTRTSHTWEVTVHGVASATLVIQLVSGPHSLGKLDLPLPTYKPFGLSRRLGLNRAALNAPVWLVFTFVPQDGSEPEMGRMAQLAGHQQGVIALERLSLAMETDPQVSFLKEAWAFLPAEAKVSRVTETRTSHTWEVTVHGVAEATLVIQLVSGFLLRLKKHFH